MVIGHMGDLGCLARLLRLRRVFSHTWSRPLLCRVSPLFVGKLPDTCRQYVGETTSTPAACHDDDLLTTYGKVELGCLSLKGYPYAMRTSTWSSVSSRLSIVLSLVARLIKVVFHTATLVLLTVRSPSASPDYSLLHGLDQQLIDTSGLGLCYALQSLLLVRRRWLPAPPDGRSPLFMPVH